MNDGIIILAETNSEASEMEKKAKRAGENVLGTTVWAGPIPPNSYRFIGPFMRMSTPEFFTMRNVWEIEDVVKAIEFVNEMCGMFATRRTSYVLGEDEVENLDEPRTTTARLIEYLNPIKDSLEGKKAIAVVNLASDGITTPSASHDAAVEAVDLLTLKHEDHFFWAENIETLVCVRDVNPYFWLDEHGEFMQISPDCALSIMSEHNFVWSAPSFYKDGGSIMTAV